MPASVSRVPSAGGGTPCQPVVESSSPMPAFLPTMMSVRLVHVTACIGSFPFMAEPYSTLQIHPFLSSTGISDLGPL